MRQAANRSHEVGRKKQLTAVGGERSPAEIRRRVDADELGGLE
jgi:hypothetical protein